MYVVLYVCMYYFLPVLVRLRVGIRMLIILPVYVSIPLACYTWCPPSVRNVSKTIVANFIWGLRKDAEADDDGDDDLWLISLSAGNKGSPMEEELAENKTERETNAREREELKKEGRINRENGTDEVANEQTMEI